MSKWLKDRYDYRDVRETLDYHGDLFDCIPREKQPSVRARRAQGIEVTFPDEPPMTEAERARFEADRVPFKADEQCPQGHVPMRRIPLSEVAGAGTLEKYLLKDTDGFAPAASVNNRDYATVGANATNYGAESYINLWGPYVEGTDDHSISQIWVSGGSPGTTSYQSVEAGWRRYTWLGDTRLFVYSYTSSSAGYGTAGGFVQTNMGVALDTTFASLSVSGGAQHERKLTIQKAGGPSGDWWFGYQGNWIGYWPRTRFSAGGIRDSAAVYRFGGEVYDTPGGNHTGTDMGGDGSFASGGFGHAAYQHHLTVFNWTSSAIAASDAPVAVYLVSTPSCYDLALTKDTTNAWRHWIYFGGPGYSNPNCVTP